MAEQRWFCFFTSTSSSCSLYRRRLPLIVSAFFLLLASPLPVVLSEATSRPAVPELKETSEQQQLDRRVPGQQRWRPWFSISGSDDHATTDSDKKGQLGGRRFLGSSPPSCTDKCGPCQPCRPVAVRVPPSQIKPTPDQYYPVEWRCECGGKIFIP